jgi:predicted esterase YcpF (UPF0227 family)
MTIVIHGFGSAGKGGKAMLFREYFKSLGKPCIAPSLSYVPELAMDTLEQLVESYDNVTLVGSSLGGYYAIYLAEKYGLKAVLINPAVDSAQTLKKRVVEVNGMAMNYHDGSQYTWNTNHVEMLKKYRVDEVKNGEYMLLLQTGDDVLDYRDAVAKLPHATTIVEEGGTHPFEGIERHFERIVAFFEEREC